jgi:hypothetical protein
MRDAEVAARRLEVACECGRTVALSHVRLVDVIADAKPAITAILTRRGLQRTRGELDGGARVNFVSEVGDDSAEDSDLGE